MTFFYSCCVLNEHNMRFINVHKCQQVILMKIFLFVANLSVFNIYDQDNKNRVLLTFPFIFFFLYPIVSIEQIYFVILNMIGRRVLLH
jgi:hypothetical protein